jgi:predicted kinase
MGALATPLVIVTGPPASGKTTLAARLSEDCRVPLITKDGIKEAMLDEAGSVDRDSSQRLGRAAWAVLWHLAEVELAAGRSALLEGNFSSEHATGQLTRLAGKYHFATLQIHCAAPIDVLHTRYGERIDARHPGHADAERVADIRPLLDPELYLLPVSGDLIRVETSSLESFDYESVKATVDNHLAAG